MKLQIIAIFLACFALNEIKAQKIGFGTCVTVPINSGFNASLYSGLWYEQYKFPVIYELGQTCVTAQYGYVNASYVNVFNNGFFKLLKFNVSAKGYAMVYNSSAPNYLTVAFPQSQIFGPSTKPNYMVWATDYLTYSLVYSCNQLSFLGVNIKAESVWILSRQKQLNSTFVGQLSTLLTTNGVNLNTFQPTDQKNC